MPYCTVKCYKNHGQQCTEGFYKDQVMNVMASEKDPSPEDKENMAKMLKRVHEEQQEAQDLVQDDVIMERFQELSMKDDIEIDMLTPDEKAMFLRHVAEGALTKFIEPWTPWWTQSEASYLQNTSVARNTRIQVLDGDDEQASEVDPTVYAPKYPVGLLSDDEHRKLPPLNSILQTKKPSPCLGNHLISILHAYVRVMQRYNGDYRDCAVEAAYDLLDFCPVLSRNAVYQSMSQVYMACNDQASLDADKTNYFVDVAQLLKSRRFVLDVLNDARHLIQTASDLQKKKKKLLQAERKLWFYLLWTNEQSIRKLAHLQCTLPDF